MPDLDHEKPRPGRRWPPGPRRTIRVPVSYDPETDRMLRELAASRGTSLAQALIDAVRAFHGNSAKTA